MSQSITISWPARALSPNVTASHWRKSAARKVQRKEAWALASAGKIVGGDGPFHIRIDAYPKAERRRDHDNLLASLKGALDGLAEAMGVDDHLFRPVVTIHPANGQGVVTITVEAMPL